MFTRPMLQLLATLSSNLSKKYKYRRKSYWEISDIEWNCLNMLPSCRIHGWKKQKSQPKQQKITYKKMERHQLGHSQRPE